MKFEINPEQKRKMNKFFKSYWKAGVLALFLVVFSIVLIQFGGKKDKEDSLKESTTTQGSLESTKESLENGKMALKKDAYPPINDLMKRYFQAKFDCDVDTLNKIVSPVEGYTLEQLQKERYGKEGDQGYNELENYEVKSCYTKEGLLEGTYVVWVHYEMKYINANTPVPGLLRLYICTDDNGGLYIYNGSIDGEASNYIENLSSMADVAELKNEIDMLYYQAIYQDERLNNIFDRMEAVAIQAIASGANSESESSPDAETASGE